MPLGLYQRILQETNSVLAVKKSDKAITIVMEDPEDIATIDSVKRLTGLEPDIVVGGIELLNKAMDQLYGEITKAGQVEEAIQGITVISGDEDSSKRWIYLLRMRVRKMRQS